MKEWGQSILPCVTSVYSDLPPSKVENFRLLAENVNGFASYELGGYFFSLTWKSSAVILDCG